MVSWQMKKSILATLTVRCVWDAHVAVLRGEASARDRNLGSLSISTGIKREHG